MQSHEEAEKLERSPSEFFLFWNDIWLIEPTVSLRLFMTCCPHQPIWQHGARGMTQVAI